MCRQSAAGEHRIAGIWACGSSSASCGLLRRRLPSETKERAAEWAVEVSQPDALEEQHPREELVEWCGRRRNVSVRARFGSQPTPSLRQPDCEQRKKQREVRVGHANDREPRRQQESCESRAIVPADLVT